MDKEIEQLIRLNVIRDIEIALLKEKRNGSIIPTIVFETITSVEKTYEY